MRKFLPGGKSARQLVFDSLGGLWDNTPITKWQQTSIIIGDFYEEASKNLLTLGENKIKRYDTSGELCPDLVEDNHHEFYVESKAHGPAGSRFVIYTKQLIAYRAFLNTYFPEKPESQSFDPALLYIFWIHRVPKVSDCADRDSLRKALAEAGTDCFVLDFDTMRYVKYVALRSSTTAWAREQSPYYQLGDQKLLLLKKGNYTAFIAQWRLDRRPEEFDFCRTAVMGLPVYKFPMTCSVSCSLRNKIAAQPSIRSFLEAIKEVRVEQAKPERG